LGLEKELNQNNIVSINYAIDTILMMHGIILSYGGIPLIYAGDEIGTLNDYSYELEEKHKNDNRWVNRPKQNWDTVSKLKGKNTLSSKIFFGLQKMIHIRKEHAVFADTNNLKIHICHNPHVFVFERYTDKQQVWVFSNFNEVTETIAIDWLLSIGIITGKNSIDLLTGNFLVIVNQELRIKPYQQMWISNI